MNLSRSSKAKREEKKNKGEYQERGCRGEGGGAVGEKTRVVKRHIYTRKGGETGDRGVAA